MATLDGMGQLEKGRKDRRKAIIIFDIRVQKKG